MTILEMVRAIRYEWDVGKSETVLVGLLGEDEVDVGTATTTKEVEG